jgi:hypothetical protein
MKHKIDKYEKALAGMFFIDVADINQEILFQDQSMELFKRITGTHPATAALARTLNEKECEDISAIMFDQWGRAVQDMRDGFLTDPLYCFEYHTTKETQGIFCENALDYLDDHIDKLRSGKKRGIQRRMMQIKNRLKLTKNEYKFLAFCYLLGRIPEFRDFFFNVVSILVPRGDMIKCLGLVFDVGDEEVYGLLHGRLEKAFFINSDNLTLNSKISRMIIGKQKKRPQKPRKN